MHITNFKLPSLTALNAFVQNYFYPGTKIFTSFLIQQGVNNQIRFSQKVILMLALWQMLLKTVEQLIHSTIK